MTSRARAVEALARRWRATANCILDEKGYVLGISANLIGPLPAAVRRSFERGAGKELTRKMRAPHSSSALAVNSFLPWAEAAADLTLASVGGFDSVAFERVYPSGLRGTSPHLDVVAESPTHVVAIESKCLEYFTPKETTFSDAYLRISDHRCHSRWFAHVSTAAISYRHLDAAQLVKHYLGLSHSYSGRAVTLLYLYWEPSNWAAVPECTAHRAELQRFADSVMGDELRFVSLSYPELWESWLSEPWASMPEHVSKLRARYDVTI